MSQIPESVQELGAEGSDGDTRQHILSAAARLFRQRGFANVSVREICEAVGVTPPTIYHYFGSKERLFQEVIRQNLSLGGFSSALRQAVEAEPDHELRLLIFIQMVLAGFPREFLNPGLFLQDTTQISGVSVELALREFQAIDELTRCILQDGIAAGAFRSVDVEGAAAYLRNVLVAYVLIEANTDQPCQAEETARVVFDLFLNGLSK